jgi:hypothetical protein
VPEEVTPETLPADAAALPLEVSAAAPTGPLPSPLHAAGGESLRYAAPMQYVTPVQYAAPVTQAAAVPPVEPLPAVETGW